MTKIPTMGKTPRVEYPKPEPLYAHSPGFQHGTYDGLGLQKEHGNRYLPGSVVNVNQDPPTSAWHAFSPGQTRTFDTGATRDTDEGKLDFEGFLSPLVLAAFAAYMHEKRRMPDGSYRESDNWQKGIPVDAYMKSMWRHFFAVWCSYRSHKEDPGLATNIEEELLALLFNVQGMTHEILKASGYGLPR